MWITYRRAAQRAMLATAVAGLTLAGTAISTAPPARAGCQGTYLGWNNGRTICDAPKNADGSWGRCMYAGGGNSGGGFTNCYIVYPDAIPPGQPDWIPGPNMALGPGPAPRWGY